MSSKLELLHTPKKKCDVKFGIALSHSKTPYFSDSQYCLAVPMYQTVLTAPETTEIREICSLPSRSSNRGNWHTQVTTMIRMNPTHCDVWKQYEDIGGGSIRKASQRIWCWS